MLNVNPVPFPYNRGDGDATHIQHAFNRPMLDNACNISICCQMVNEYTDIDKSEKKDSISL